MKCPHCNVEFYSQSKYKELASWGVDVSSNREFQAVESHEYGVNSILCPSCYKMIISLVHNISNSLDTCGEFDSKKEEIIYPISTIRVCAKEVDNPYLRQDFIEACSVLNLSPKASAALSRRCLQNLLREKAGIIKKDLFKEIQEVIDSGNLPSYLSESIDAIRNIGNYAAHPLKSTSSGEILDVEPGEAEWALDVLEQLFDFYYVQPEIIRKKREALNAKLAAIGKPPME